MPFPTGTLRWILEIRANAGAASDLPSLAAGIEDHVRRLGTLASAVVETMWKNCGFSVDASVRITLFRLYKAANWVGQCNDHPQAGRRRGASSWNLCVGEQVVVMGKRLAIPVPVGFQVSGHSGEGTALDQKVPEPESSVVDTLEYLQLVALHVEREEIGARPRLKPWPVIYHFWPRIAAGRETIRAVRETRR